MDAWKLVAGVLVVVGILQLLAALGAPTLTAGLTTAVTGLLFLGVGYLAFYRADVDGSDDGDGDEQRAAEDGDGDGDAEE
ncbi:MAG: hypothetical protein ABEH83_05250 [Halobacterium sp.]